MLEQTVGPWDYRMLPNKLLELVKNVGNMEQEGTGYYTDSESEMLTILAYLNYGETTNITEAMREQINHGNLGYFNIFGVFKYNGDEIT